MDNISTAFSIHGVDPSNIEVTVREYTVTDDRTYRNEPYSTVTLRFYSDETPMYKTEIVLYSKDGQLAKDWTEFTKRIEASISEVVTC